MNILNQILKGIADLIGADPSTLTTDDKTLVGALNEVDADIDDINNNRLVDFVPSSTDKAGVTGLIPAPTQLTSWVNNMAAEKFLSLDGWLGVMYSFSQDTNSGVLRFWSDSFPLDYTPGSGSRRGRGTIVPVATPSLDGVMSRTDKQKLDALPNIHFSTEEPKASDGEDGDMWLVYKPSTEG